MIFGVTMTIMMQLLCISEMDALQERIVTWYVDFKRRTRGALGSRVLEVFPVLSVPATEDAEHDGSGYLADERWPSRASSRAHHDVSAEQRSVAAAAAVTHVMSEMEMLQYLISVNMGDIVGIASYVNAINDEVLSLRSRVGEMQRTISQMNERNSSCGM